MSVRVVLVWPLCWSLYGAGHLASLVVDKLDGDGEPTLWFDLWFQLYQATMGWSFELQKWAEGDPPRISNVLPWQPSQEIDDVL